MYTQNTNSRSAWKATSEETRIFRWNLFLLNDSHIPFVRESEIVGNSKLVLQWMVTIMMQDAVVVGCPGYLLVLPKRFFFFLGRVFCTKNKDPTADFRFRDLRLRETFTHKFLGEISIFCDPKREKTSTWAPISLPQTDEIEAVISTTNAERQREATQRQTNNNSYLVDNQPHNTLHHRPSKPSHCCQSYPSPYIFSYKIL